MKATSMTLSIKDPEADALARRLAEQTGESLTDAVKRALQERLERESARRPGAGLAARLLGIGRHCAAHLSAPFAAGDHAGLLYDDRGLPK
jgi:antitoxin VapB